MSFRKTNWRALRYSIDRNVRPRPTCRQSFRIYLVCMIGEIAFPYGSRVHWVVLLHMINGSIEACETELEPEPLWCISIQKMPVRKPSSRFRCLTGVFSIVPSCRLWRLKASSGRCQKKLYLSMPISCFGTCTTLWFLPSKAASQDRRVVAPKFIFVFGLLCRKKLYPKRFFSKSRVCIPLLCYQLSRNVAIVLSLQAFKWPTFWTSMRLNSFQASVKIWSTTFPSQVSVKIQMRSMWFPRIIFAFRGCIRIAWNILSVKIQTLPNMSSETGLSDPSEKR